MTAEIIELDKQRERRRYISLPHGSGEWQQITASVAIEGLDLDDINAEIVGRMAAGEMTLQEAQRVIRRRLNVSEPM